MVRSFLRSRNSPSPPIDLYPNSFNQLTNPSSRNSVLVSSIQHAPGATPLAHHFLFSVFHFSFPLCFHSLVDSLSPVAKLNCFLFKGMQTLCAKHRGWHAFQWHRHSCLCSDEGKSPDRQDRCRTTYQRFQGRVSSFAFRVSTVQMLRFHPSGVEPSTSYVPVFSYSKLRAVPYTRFRLFRLLYVRRLFLI